MKTNFRKDFGVVSTDVRNITNEERWAIKAQIVSALRESNTPAVAALCVKVCSSLEIDTAEIAKRVAEKSIEFENPFIVKDEANIPTE